MTTGLPSPPDPLPDLSDGDVVTVPAGTVLVRWHDNGGVHPRRHDQFRWFGPLPGRGRFDHHPEGPPGLHEPHHGIIYVALDDPTAERSGPAATGHVLDVLCAEMVQDGDELMVVPGATVTVFRTSGDLDLLDLRSRWGQATRAGMHLSTAPHHLTQPWARAIRAAYPALHGILYIPSTGGRAVAAALNESAAGHLAGTVELSRRVADDEMLTIIDRIAARLGFTVVLEG